MAVRAAIRSKCYDPERTHVKYLSASFVVLGAVCLCVAPATAQSGQPAKTESRQGKAPAPLFPKHRRGLYINSDNLETIDATPQSPPLAVDDPGVPDEGEYEINLLTEADLAADARTVNVATVDANYGTVLRGFGHQLPTQLKLEFPIVAREEHGEPYQMGLGTSAFGLKFNFYNDESRGLRVSIYPQLQFSTGGSVEKRIAEAGQTLMIPLLVSHESRYLTMVANAAINTTIHDPGRDSTAELGFGAGRAFFRKLAVMGDLRTSSTTNLRRDRLVSADAGFIYGVRKAIWYSRIGHSLLSDDGRHAFISFGVKVLVDTKHS
jgi:hypothetical protein